MNKLITTLTTLLMFVLCTKVSASDFTVSIETSDETCIGNGSVTFNIENTNIGNVFEIKIYNGTTQTVLTPNLNPSNPLTISGVTATSFSQTFDGLIAGNYNVVIIEYENSVAKTVAETFTVVDGKKDLEFTSEADACTGRIVTTTIDAINTGTAPYIYTIRNSSGTIIEQSTSVNETSYTFSTSLPNGNYTMNVTDACGTTEVYVLAIAPPNVTFELEVLNRLYTTHKGNTLTDCDTVERAFNIKYSENGVEKTIPAGRFPLTVTYTVPGSGGAADYELTETYNSASEMEDMVKEFPFYYGLSNELTIEVTDACGQTYPPSTFTSSINEASFNAISVSEGDCGEINSIRISRIETLDYTANNGQGYLVTIEKITSETDETIDTSFNGTFSDYTFINGVASFHKTEYRNFDIEGIPTGTYKVTMNDNCNTVSKIVTMGGPDFVLVGGRGWAACDDGNGTFHLLVDDTSTLGENKAALLTEVIVTDAPAAFRAEHGLPATGAISYDISYLIDTTTTAGAGILFASSFPAGDYTFSYTTGCNSGTGAYTVAPKTLESYESNIDITCTGFIMDASMRSNYARAIMYVQKYYPDSGKWGHPITGELYDEGGMITGDAANPNNGNAYQITPTQFNGGTRPGMQTISSAPNIQIDAGGQIRIIVQYGVYRDGHGNSNTGGGFPGWGSDSNYCQEVLEEFVVPENDIILNNFMVTECGAGDYTLIIDALGTNLTYQMIEKDGVAINGTPQSENYFENLTSGKYKVKIADTCGRETVFTFYVSEPQKLPVINSTMICEGGDGKLYIEGFSYLTVTWTKDGGALPANAVPNANGTTLNFTNFNSATNAGTYTAHLSYPPTCLDAEITYIVNGEGETVSAGTGGTFEIDKSTLTGPLNLFDYLTGPYDSGTWTETTNSGQLSDYIWDATSVISGTYTFEYSVYGLCSTTPETATVTIILTSPACVKPGNMTSGGTPTQVGITNQTQLSGWPQSVPNGFIALESQEAGMVVSRVAHVSNTPDLINDSVKEPIEGMLVYDIQDQCMKLYNGSTWNCIEKSCND